jgi:hypothetical protein
MLRILCGESFNKVTETYITLSVIKHVCINVFVLYLPILTPSPKILGATPV